MSISVWKKCLWPFFHIKHVKYLDSQYFLEFYLWNAEERKRSCIKLSKRCCSKQLRLLDSKQGYSIQLLTSFEDNISFVRLENGSVVRSRRLRATAPFEGQTKLLLSSNPVYNCFVLHVHRHCDVVTYWTNENKVIGQKFDSGAIDRWSVNRSIEQLCN